jgi:polyisoprenoid-binding protein YceI
MLPHCHACGMTTLEIGSAQGTLTFRTGVEGRAAKAGHALTVSLPDWSAVLALSGSQPTAVTVTVPWDTLSVVRGEGVLPLSPIDKGLIKKSALKSLLADSHPTLSFTSSSVGAQPGGYEVRGEVSVAGVTGPLVIAVQVARADGIVSCRAEFPFVQTAFGLKPYSAMLGSLRVSDRIDATLLATFPDPAVPEA